MKKKNILHIIEALAVGGAETLLLNTINTLGPEFNNIVVYLTGPELLAPQFTKAKLICLNHKGKASLPSTILKLRKLIKSLDVDVVHAHLLWPSIIARLACPANIRLLFSVHSILSQDAFVRRPSMRLLEKLTYNSRHEVIFVSNIAKQDYEDAVGLKGKSYILYNFISDAYFNNVPALNEFVDRPLKLISVGNLKESKNFPYLIKAMGMLKEYPVTLDIYGVGHLHAQLQNTIDAEGLKSVHLKGLATNIPELLRQYDVFVLASEHEGFGLAAIEGMARGLPCFLSELPVFREVTADHANFFDLENPEDLVNQLKEALQNPESLKRLARVGLEQVKVYHPLQYVQQLSGIYHNVT